ncbi:Phytosulfokine receptor 2 like [Forsythia ovata]|uniref:Phytosulfokine receptor 2 like n=1 Tax=Forsythia ovata TaxID=205694 RepID=A0ABD1U4K6_9LAMI
MSGTAAAQSPDFHKDNEKLVGVLVPITNDSAPQKPYTIVKPPPQPPVVGQVLVVELLDNLQFYMEGEDSGLYRLNVETLLAAAAQSPDLHKDNERLVKVSVSITKDSAPQKPYTIVKPPPQPPVVGQVMGLGQKRKSEWLTKGQKKDEEDDVCFICFDGGSLVLCDRKTTSKWFHQINLVQRIQLLSMEWCCLNLSGEGLRGKISESLGKLDGLKVLHLSHNFLEGRLPLNFSNLKQLEVLDLSHNMLSGPVLGALVGLKSIQSVNLSSNSFTGNFTDLGVFSSLIVFNISNNLFTGLETYSISDQHFHADFNSLSGQIPDSLYMLSSLEQLSLSANNFSGQLSHKLSKLSNLKTLVLCRNRFSGSFSNVFGNLTQLEQLVAHSNSFSGPLPSTLALCTKLTRQPLSIEQ